MSRHRWNKERAQASLDIILALGDVASALPNISQQLGATGLTVSSVSCAIRTHLGVNVGEALRGAPPPSPTILAPPAEGLSTEELIEARKKQVARKAAHEDARRLIVIELGHDQPIGILHFGDPHLDDNGTDIGLLERHARLVRNTDGLYGASVGDVTNNWVGRLAHLHAQQSITAEESWRLAEWFVELTRDWLYLVGGNHDAWSGAGDPLKWITNAHSALYQASEVRVGLRFKKGLEVRINARHDHVGKSQYNPAHGAMKALIWGIRDHLAICGHKHISGHGIVKDPDHLIACLAVQVASYKIWDRYSREHGFRDQALSPCAMTVIDPALPETHPDLIKLYWDPEEGAEFLTWKRRRAAARAA